MNSVLRSKLGVDLFINLFEMVNKMSQIWCSSYTAPFGHLCFALVLWHIKQLLVI